jgi:hypothetical protein
MVKNHLSHWHDKPLDDGPHRFESQHDCRRAGPQGLVERAYLGRSCRGRDARGPFKGAGGGRETGRQGPGLCRETRTPETTACRSVNLAPFWKMPGTPNVPRDGSAGVPGFCESRMLSKLSHRFSAEAH